MKTIKTDQKLRNILFVDNDKSLILDIKDRMEQDEIKEKKGIDFIFAADAKTALKKLDSSAIDLIVIEIVLPIINGYYLLDLLKKSYPAIPIIIYTRLKSPQDLAKMSNYEVHNIFLKDLMKPEDMIAIVSSKDLNKENIDHVILELKSQMKAISDSEAGKQLKLVQCPRCHLIIAPDSHYCNNCGQKIAKKMKQTLRSTPKEGENEKPNENPEETKAKDDKKTVQDNQKTMS